VTLFLLKRVSRTQSRGIDGLTTVVNHPWANTSEPPKLNCPRRRVADTEATQH
jgi:hypothetical protein